MTFRLHVIVLSDDDGKNRARIDTQHMDVFIAHANFAFRPAGVQFEFHPEQGDFIELHSTQLNRMEDFAQPKLARTIVRRNHERIVVFVRKHTTDGHDLSAFAGDNFAVISGLEAYLICGREDPSLLSHELGHYFGLSHTHRVVFDTIGSADAWVRQRLSVGLSIDGDGFGDTPPTPMINELTCVDTEEVQLGGRHFKIPRNNVMPYYSSGDPSRLRQTFSDQQLARIHQNALRLVRRGVGRVATLLENSSEGSRTATIEVKSHSKE